MGGPKNDAAPFLFAVNGSLIYIYIYMLIKRKKRKKKSKKILKERNKGNISSTACIFFFYTGDLCLGGFQAAVAPESTPYIQAE